MADPVIRIPLTRRAFTAAAAAALTAPAALAQSGQPPAPPAQPGADFFPFGTHIYRQPSLPLGQAILLGTLIGAALEAGREEGKKVRTTLLPPAGVKPDRAGRLLRRRRVLDTFQAWFLFNTGSDPVEELAPLEGRRLVAELIGEPADVVGKAVRVKVPPLDVRCLIVDQPA